MAERRAEIFDPKPSRRYRCLCRSTRPRNCPYLQRRRPQRAAVGSTLEGQPRHKGTIGESQFFPRGRDFLAMRGREESHRGNQTLSLEAQAGPSASKARRYSFFPFSLRGDAPQPPTASEVVAPRSAAAVEAQTAPTEVRRPSHARRGFAISWIAATLVTAALVGICCHTEAVAGDEPAELKQAAESATAELLQSLQREHDRAEALATELAKARRELETQVALSSKKGDEAAQFKQAAESATAELRQSLQRELDWLRDLDEAAQLKQAAATAELRLSLQQEHDRAEALATELAKARRDLETQVALSSKKGDEAAQFKQAAESATAELRQSLQRELDWLRDLDEAAQLKLAAATAELRQSLQREHDMAEALATELAKARRDLETQVALSSKKGDEAAQFKQAAEAATADLRQSLQRGHDRAEALATELAKARRDLETQVALSSKKGDEAAQLKQAAESATAELRQSLQREHDRAEALITELAQARRTMEQKPAGVEEKPDAKQSEGVAAENSKPENKPVETAPLPKRVEHEPRGRALSPSCFYYRTYDPASGTYRSFDGRIRSCR